MNLRWIVALAVGWPPAVAVLATVVCDLVRPNRDAYPAVILAVIAAAFPGSVAAGTLIYRRLPASWPVDPRAYAAAALTAPVALVQAFTAFFVFAALTYQEWIE